MQGTTRVLLPFIFLLSSIVSAQDTTVTDTIKSSTQMQEVVITGQIEPQSLKKSVYNVRVISKKDIQRLAANNLGDVLNQYLNITVKPSGSDGRSTVSMFGLDGQYFKILVDNIPLISDSGLGNNVDLTQVNLDDVEQIEIIEGSMGVTHGSNAVSGILNIITKKSAKNKWEISATVQEETIGDEYSWFDKGRHIQALKVSHTINDNWFASIGANRNDFTGYLDNMQGKNYTENDGLRGYSWLPKDQIVSNALIGYTKKDFRVFYKFDYFNEIVNYYNPVVVPQSNGPFEPVYFSNDKNFVTNRFYHHLNSYGHLFSKLTYNVSLSYQRQKRDEERFKYYIESEEEQDKTSTTYLSKEVIYSTGNVTNFFSNKKYDLQVGYEIVNENGTASPTSGTFRDEEQLAANGIQARLENYDFFASAEMNFTDRFSVRPGFRYSFQSKFEDQQAVSLGLRYLMDRGFEARGSVGRSYRTPNFDEMYTYFVDSNHNIQGNIDLIPEQSMSYEVSLKKTTVYTSGAQLINSILVSHLNVDDRISLVLASTDPIWAYKYMNIDSYKNWNFSTINQMSYKNLEAKIGASIVGVSQKLTTGASGATSDDNYLYSLQLNTSVAYTIPKWNTTFSAYYKYNGRFQQYIEAADANGDAYFFLSETEGYSMLDASVRKTFFKNKFDVTLGARNLLDIKNIQTTQAGATGPHGGSSSDILLAYGRSYFLKLTYNLNFN